MENLTSEPIDQSGSNLTLDVLHQEIIECRKCPRLVAWREEVALKKRRAYRNETYWGKPIPGFGDYQARVGVIGLAPGAHGANRTGRSFTGDGAGEFLYRALYSAGFASQPTAVHRDDGLILTDTYISAVCRCVPPDNKPEPEELNRCRPFWTAEIRLLKNVQVLVALGKIAFDEVIKFARAEWGYEGKAAFRHSGVISLGEGRPTLVTSYHPSRQNTQTGRLTEPMFDEIWAKVKEHLR